MSTKSKQTQTSTVTPTNPTFVTTGAEGLAGNIQNLSQQDPASFFAGASPLQEQAFGAFSGLGAQAPTWLDQAAQMAGAAGDGVQVGPTAQATAQSAAQNMGSYFNPYLQQVAGNATSDMVRGFQDAMNASGQGAALAGQYGGSRQGVMDQRSLETGLRSLGSTLDNIYAGGFNTAAGLGAADADRFTGTSQFNAGQANQMTALQAQLADAAQGRKLQGAGVLGGLGQFGLGGLMDAGGTQQAIDQNIAAAPLTVQQALSGSFGSLPLGLFQGNTSTGTATGKTSGLGAWAQGIGGLMQGVGAVGQAFSDARLKQDVRPVGKDARGRDWYDFRYLWDAPGVTRRGVMAQEILATEPDAVATHESGFLMVDYDKLEAA